MNTSSFGDRMKGYEKQSRFSLLRRTPVIVRVDGKAFHSFCRQITPVNDHSSRLGPSEKMHKAMMYTAFSIARQMQNCVLAYTQSDEISFLLTDWSKFETEQWFNANIQKIASVTSSMATAYFNIAWKLQFSDTGHMPAFFDARCFNIPMEEVTNYFIWRQQDATRNSVQSIARKFFSQKDLIGKYNEEVQEMLWNEHNCNWNDYDTWKKRGSCVYRKVNDPENVMTNWQEDDDIPIFTKDRYYIERYLKNE